MKSARRWIPCAALAYVLGAEEPPGEQFTRIAESVRKESFPELAGVRIRLRPFDGGSSFFYARFTCASFLFRRRLEYTIGYDRRALARGAPGDALRAVMAHELAHVAYYRSRKRIRLLGLVRMASTGFAARFERATDREAIARGYGPGLRAYREWLYRNIAPDEVPKKKRTYLTPEEIDAAIREPAAKR